MIQYVWATCAITNFTKSVIEIGGASKMVEGDELWHFVFDSHCGHCTNATGYLQGNGVWFRRIGNFTKSSQPIACRIFYEMIYVQLCLVGGCQAFVAFGAGLRSCSTALTTKQNICTWHLFTNNNIPQWGNYIGKIFGTVFSTLRSVDYPSPCGSSGWTGGDLTFLAHPIFSLLSFLFLVISFGELKLLRKVKTQCTLLDRHGVSEHQSTAL